MTTTPRRPFTQPLLELVVVAVLAGGLAATVAATCAPRPRSDADDAARLEAFRRRTVLVHQLRRQVAVQAETVTVRVDRWLPRAAALVATDAPAFSRELVVPVLADGIALASSCRDLARRCDALQVAAGAALDSAQALLADQRERIRRLERGCRVLGPIPCPVFTVGPGLTLTPAGALQPGLTLTIGFPLPRSP